MTVFLYFPIFCTFARGGTNCFHEVFSSVLTFWDTISNHQRTTSKGLHPNLSTLALVHTSTRIIGNPSQHNAATFRACALVLQLRPTCVCLALKDMIFPTTPVPSTPGMSCARTPPAVRRATAFAPPIRVSFGAWTYVETPPGKSSNLQRSSARMSKGDR